MTARPPLVIVSLPGRTVNRVRAEITEARDAGADVVELRLDRWADGERARLAEVFPSPLPLLATYRSAAEGGEGLDDPGARARVFQEIRRYPFRYVDLEVARDPPRLAAGMRSPLSIRSEHLAPGTTPETVSRALHSDPGESVFVKVVVPASVGEALGGLREIVPPDRDRRAILHTTGPSSPLYRMWAWRLGFPAVYASLPEVSGRHPVAEGQIPVDRLRWYFGAESPGPLFAVVGHPIDHSASPAIFSAWMRATGERGLYVGLDVSSEAEFASAVAAFGETGFRGVNVTRPWKVPALELASRIGPGAGPCGCANVLTFGPDGVVEAENTDLAAILRRLRELVAQGAWDGRRLTIVGSGGAARAVLVAARTLGSEATVFARDRDAMKRLSSEFGATAAWHPPMAPVELLINATPVGRREAGAPGIDFTPWVGPNTRVIDLVYAADDPGLPRLAAARGAAYEDGWRLLVYQASESYAIWFGAPPEESVVRAALGGSS